MVMKSHYIGKGSGLSSGPNPDSTASTGLGTDGNDGVRQALAHAASRGWTAVGGALDSIRGSNGLDVAARFLHQFANGRSMGGPMVTNPATETGPEGALEVSAGSNATASKGNVNSNSGDGGPANSTPNSKKKEDEGAVVPS